MVVLPEWIEVTLPLEPNLAVAPLLVVTLVVLPEALTLRVLPLAVVTVLPPPGCVTVCGTVPVDLFALVELALVLLAPAPVPLVVWPGAEVLLRFCVPAVPPRFPAVFPVVGRAPVPVVGRAAGVAGLAAGAAGLAAGAAGLAAGGLWGGGGGVFFWPQARPGQVSRIKTTSNFSANIPPGWFSFILHSPCI